MVFIAISVGLAIVCFLFWLFSKGDEFWTHLSLCFWIAAAVLLFVYWCTYSWSLSNNGRLTTFHSEVFAAYKTVAEKTERMTVGNERGGGQVLIKSEHLQQAPEAAKRWQELRDKIEWYNNTLRIKHVYYGNWFLRQWVAEPPKDLPYIKMN